MDYRYQETLSWIIPGFYLLFYLSMVIWCTFPDCEISAAVKAVCNNNISDGIVALLVFAIPIMSLIVGWTLNGFAGYLFRYIMKSPTTSAYNEEYDKNEDGNRIEGFIPKDDLEAERIFDKARRSIDLEKVDRFYYRYVASRNMYFAQLVICVLSVFFVTSSFDGPIGHATSFLIGSCVLLYLYWLMAARDLNTHARYVFIEYKKYKMEKAVV